MRQQASKARKMMPYIKLSLASLLFAVSLTAAFWDYKVSTPKDNWSKIATTRSPDRKTTGYQMMVYVDRPILRSDQTCKIFLRIKNAGKHPLELTSTYLTNHHYVNGKLYGEEIGDWELPDAPLKLLPGEIKDVPYTYGITHRPRYPMQIGAIGTRGFQFCGFGLHTNTVTVYDLPNRSSWLVLAAVTALMSWRAWLGTKLR